MRGGGGRGSNTQHVLEVAPVSQQALLSVNICCVDQRNEG